jgi:hypothetical protein
MTNFFNPACWQGSVIEKGVIFRRELKSEHSLRACLGFARWAKNEAFFSPAPNPKHALMVFTPQ